MVTQVLTIGLYCPLTGETRVLHGWLHGSPFDTAESLLERMQEACRLTDEDWVEVVETRQSRNPHPVETRWSQMALFDMVASAEPETT